MSRLAPKTDIRSRSNGINSNPPRLRSRSIQAANSKIDSATQSQTTQSDRLLGYPLKEPLTLEQAAGVLDIRRRNARQVTRIPAFQRLMAQLTGELRSGGRARAIHTLLSIMADVGENTAADRAVRVKAAKEVIGEEGKGGVSVNVNVGVQNNVVGIHFELRNSSRVSWKDILFANPR